MIGELAADGFRTVVIVDPHPANVPGSRVTDEGLAGRLRAKGADGTLFEAPVWPSQAEKDPRPSVFPDFARSATRRWWGGFHDNLVKLGVAGIWNDMNEPAVFDSPTGTFPVGVRHDADEHATDHREVHNVYGMLMSRATHEGLLALRPEAPALRPHARHLRRRAALGRRLAGGQRLDLGAPARLGAAPPRPLGLGLPVRRGRRRWLRRRGHGRALHALAPERRLHPVPPDAHRVREPPEQEPWSYGTRHEAANRRAIELRYELLPQVYTVMEEASRTGIPAMRPLLLGPGRPRTWAADDTFLFGRDLLVAPLPSQELGEKPCCLPKGRGTSSRAERNTREGATSPSP